MEIDYTWLDVSETSLMERTAGDESVYDHSLPECGLAVPFDRLRHARSKTQKGLAKITSVPSSSAEIE